MGCVSSLTSDDSITYIKPKILRFNKINSNASTIFKKQFTD